MVDRSARVSLASRSAAVTAWAWVRVAGSGAATSGLSVELTESTSPALTATETRPSWAAGSLPNLWRSSTTEPLPTGVVATVSSESTAEASRANAPRLCLRYCLAAVTGSFDRPVASLPVRLAGVPNLLYRAPASRVRGATAPGRLSTKSCS